jgi:hypothetical protein
MALTFPSNPNVNDIYQPSGSAASYRWTGTYWQIRQSANPLFGASQSGSVLQIDAAGYAVASPVVIINGQMSVTASTATSASFSGTSTSASFASSSSNATSASFSTSASFTTTSSYAVSSSFATTSSYAVSASYGLTASFATTASYGLSASFATTASFAVTASNLSSNVTPYYIQAGNASGQSMPTGQTIVTNWTTTANNTGSAWNATTGIFTCPRMGYYRLRAQVAYTANTGSINAEFNIGIAINGAIAFTGVNFKQVASSVFMPVPPAEGIRLLNAGDVVSFLTYHNAGGNISLWNRGDINLITIQELPNFITK